MTKLELITNLQELERIIQLAHTINTQISNDLLDLYLTMSKTLSRYSDVPQQ